MRSRFCFVAILIAATCFFINCKKKSTAESPAPPAAPSAFAAVNTSPVVAVGNVSAECGGNVTSEGTSAITAVGVCWDVNPSPTTLKPHTTNGAGTGSFQSHITGLDPATKYYVRAYVTNAAGTKYGEELSFKTIPSWITLIPSNQTSNQVRAIASLGADIFIAVAGPNSGLRKSSDNGVTFSSVGPNINGSVNALFAQGSGLFVATTNGLFASFDSGITFTRSDGSIPNPYINSISGNGTVLYCGSSGSGLYSSSDNGTTWTAVSTANSFITVITRIVVNGSNIIINGGNSNKLYLSSDNGGSWKDISAGLPSNNIITDIFASGTNLYVSESSSIIYKSTDNGTTWNILTDNLSSSINKSIQKGSNLFAGGLGIGVLLSVDEGANWSPINAGLPTNAGILSLGLSGNTIFTGTSDGGFFSLNIP